MTPETAAWFAAWWPLWAPFLLLAVGGSITGIWALITRRDGEKVARKNPLPPTWPEMWARIDAQDTRIAAQDEKIDAQADEITELRRALKVTEREKEQIISHVQTLEAGYPNPPGPPPRPWKFLGDGLAA